MKTHEILVLDRSGSMASCGAATIAGFNTLVEQAQQLAASDDADLRVTLVTFNHEVEVASFAAPIATLRPLTAASYRPTGTTAMLDAVGAVLERIARDVPDDEETRYLVMIVSDGAENASTRFDYPTIAEMIQQRQGTGRWTFAYLGANQDLAKIEASLGIPRRNISAFKSDERGAEDGWTSISRYSRAYLGSGASASEASFADAAAAGEAGESEMSSWARRVVAAARKSGGHGKN